MGPADDWRAVQPPLPGWAPIPWGSNFDDDAGSVAADDAAGDGEGAAVVAVARDKTPQPRTRSGNE